MIRPPQPIALTGPGIYRTANGRKVTWSVLSDVYVFDDACRVILAVESSDGEGQFSLTYSLEGKPCDAFRASLNTPAFFIVSKDSESAE